MPVKRKKQLAKKKPTLVTKQNGAFMRRKTSSGNGGALGLILAVVLIIIVIGGVFTMVKSPSKKQCEKIIAEFQDSCNDMNISGMIGCLKPSLINTGLQLGTSFVGKDDIKGVFSAFGGLDEMGVGTGLDVEELFQMMKLETKKYGFPSKERKVICKVSFGAFSQYVNIYVGKMHGDPYISKLKFYKE